MLIKDIGKKWLVCNYNYVSLLDKNNHDSEYSVREYYKSIMKTYAESSNSIYGVHKFGAFIDALALPQLLDLAKYALWTGMIEHRVSCYHNDFYDDVIVRIDSDFMVEAELTTGDSIVSIADPILMDDLELFEREDVKEFLHGITVGVKNECKDKADCLRVRMRNEDSFKILTNCDLTLMSDEGMFYLVS